MGNFSLSTWDLAIMVIYALGIIAYGLYNARAKNSEEYFLAGRDMTWPIVGIALVAANISSSTLVGLAGDAYKTNTHVYNYEWLAAVVLVFFAIFFLPFYLRSKVYTMPEFLERRYDSRSRYYFSFITIVGNVLIDTASGLYVGTVVLKLLFPGLEAWIIVVILAMAAAAYTIPGGLNSVIQTEVVQAVLLLLGSTLITYYAFEGVGGWSGLIDGLNARGAAGTLPDPGGAYQPDTAEEVLSLVRPASDNWYEFLLGTGGDAFMPWTGLLLGAPILGFYFWANNQFMVQRVLGAKDLNHGRMGALFAGLIKLPVLFIMVFPGTCAILLFADLDVASLNYPLASGEICRDLSQCPNATYPLLLFNLLPTGILGLVLAGLLAAMMSSVSATFNSASTLVTMDFVAKLRPEMTSKQLVRVGQITTGVLVILASAWAPLIERFDSLWEYLQDILSYIAPPVASAFILGLFWKRANGTGAFISLMTGFAFAIVAVISRTYGLVGWLNEMHFLHRTVFLFVLCMLVNVVVSLATAPPDPEQVAHYTWNRGILRAETEELRGLPWYKNYRTLAIGLLIVTAILVGYFW